MHNPGSSTDETTAETLAEPTALVLTPASTPTRWDPWSGVQTSFLLGLGLGTVFMLGSLLLWSWGSWISLPVGLTGCLLPLIGALLGLGARAGACPQCGSEVRVMRGQPSVTCGACQTLIQVEAGRLVVPHP